MELPPGDVDRAPKPNPEKRRFTLSVGSQVKEGAKVPWKNDCQDRVWVNPEFGGLVCDGIGGGKDGGIAANIVTNTIKNFFEGERPEPSSLEEAKELLKKVAVLANDQIHEAKIAGTNPLADNSGTTLNLFYPWRGYILNLNYGDSQASIIRNNELTDISLADVSYDPNNPDLSPEEKRIAQDIVNNVTDPQKLSEDEMRFWNQRHQLSRAIRGYKYGPSEAPIDRQRERFRRSLTITEHILEDGDILTAYTDGITGKLGIGKRLEVLTRHDYAGNPQAPKNAADDLVDTAESDTSARALAEALDDRGVIVMYASEVKTNTNSPQN